MCTLQSANAQQSYVYYLFCLSIIDNIIRNTSTEFQLEWCRRGLQLIVEKCAINLVDSSGDYRSIHRANINYDMHKLRLHVTTTTRPRHLYKQTRLRSFIHLYKNVACRQISIIMITMSPMFHAKSTFHMSNLQQ